MARASPIQTELMNATLRAVIADATTSALLLRRHVAHGGHAWLLSVRNSTVAGFMLKYSLIWHMSMHLVPRY